MSRCLVLDVEALSALTGRPGKKQREVRAALTAAVRLRHNVVPALDWPSSTAPQSDLPSWTHVFELIVDAHVVAATVEGGGGVLLTGDRGDLERIAAPYPSVLAVSVD